MAQVRALTTLFHSGILVRAGEVFEYADELAKNLKGEVTEGMELVTKKTTAAFVRTQAEAHQKLVDTAVALRGAYNNLKAELEANPARGDLVQLVLDAESAAVDAEKAVAADAGNTDLV